MWVGPFLPRFPSYDWSVPVWGCSLLLIFSESVRGATSALVLFSLVENHLGANGNRPSRGREVHREGVLQHAG